MGPSDAASFWRHCAPIVVSSLAPGSPAAKAGTLFIGDEIVRVNGVDVDEMALEDMTALLQSELLAASGSTLRLVVRHSSAARRLLTSEMLLGADNDGSVNHRAPAFDRVLAIPLAMCSVHLNKREGTLRAGVCMQGRGARAGVCEQERDARAGVCVCREGVRARACEQERGARAGVCVCSEGVRAPGVCGSCGVGSLTFTLGSPDPCSLLFNRRAL